MNLQEYATRQGSITARLIALILQYAGFFRQPRLTSRDWEGLLDLLYPYVDDARRESAELGREFFDQQNTEHTGTFEPIDLAAYRREWFSEAMFPAREALSRIDAPESALAELALRAAKEVENGSRKTIIRAVKADPESRVVQGWARVATGRETCGFCMMLVSRGPVYSSAREAGLEADDTAAIDLLDAGDAQALDELRTRWHPGCDCKVVPVFDRADWPGRSEFLEAKALWAEVTKGYTGKEKFDVFRRYIESGEADLGKITIAA